MASIPLNIGGGGTGSDEVTAAKAQVLEGKTAVTRDSNDEPGEGSLPKNKVMESVGGNIPANSVLASAQGSGGTIATKNNSGNANVNLDNPTKSYDPGYYPNAHGAKVNIPAAAVLQSEGGDIVQKNDSGNTTLTHGANTKSFPAGYYPNAHGATVPVFEWV